MTDEELIARLRGLADCDTRAGAPLGKCMADAADRIKDLVERNKELALQLLATQGQVADRIEALIAERDALQAWKRYWSGEYDTVLAGRADEYDRAEAAEAKLAENEVRLGKAVEALEALIQQTHDCEKELTEDLHHVDFCGESAPLTNARATLAEIKGERHE